MRASQGSTAFLFAFLLLTSASGALAHGAIDFQLAELDRRLLVEGESFELLLARGDLRRLHRDWSLALSDFDRAAQLAPERPEVDYFRARVHLEADQVGQAEEYLRRLLDRLSGKRSEKWRGPAHRLLAKVLMQSGRSFAAAEQYDLAITVLEQPRPQIYLDRARALRAAGSAHLERAIRGLDQGIARLGSLVTLEQMALELELEARDYGAAIVRVDRILDAALRIETWLVRKGEILERAGRSQDAAIVFEAARAAWLEAPPPRRLSRAMVSLERRIHAGLERLGSPGGKSR